MSYLVLARKLRPQTFEEIVGQEAVVRTLQNALSSGRIHHAFLFCGPRGTGKTSTARILAKALNCEQGPTPTPCNQCRSCTEITGGTAVDVLEIDGASNTGVDDVRQLRENARYLPVTGRRKIYVIDEVHMLSVSAFNALLKTLEEPPEHVTFIFATTEPHKIPVTILSRCQRYDLGRVAPEKLIAMLRERLPEEGITIDEEGLDVIARASEGSVRDALSLVDQVISFAGVDDIQVDGVRSALGLSDRQTLLRLSAALLEHDGEAALATLDDVYQRGQDLIHFARSFLEHLRDLTVAALVRDPAALIQVSAGDLESLTAQVKDVDPLWLQQLFDRFAIAVDRVARSDSPKLVLEMAILGLVRSEPLQPLGDLLERLEALEAGHPAPPSRGPAAPPPRGTSRPASTSGRARPAPRSRESSSDRRPRSRAADADRSAGDPAPVATARQDPPPAVPAPRDPDPSSRPVRASLPSEPMAAWEALVKLAERHSRRLAANLYRATLLALRDEPDQLGVEIGVARDSFEHRQLSAPGAREELAGYFTKALARPVVVTIRGQAAGQEATPLAAAPAPTAAPEEPAAPAPPDKPLSLRERDQRWRREERARKRKEALDHAAVKDAVDVLEGEVKEVHVVVDQEGPS